MRETMATPLKVVFRVSTLLAAVALLGVVATAGGAAEGNTTLVSVSSSGNQADEGSETPSVSAGGRFVAFSSRATNLVPNDTNNRRDVFVRDRQTGTTERVSVSSTGEQAQNNVTSSFFGSRNPSIGAGGRFVVFESDAINLVPNDTNVSWDVFVHDRQTGTTRRLSVNSLEKQGDWNSDTPSISADGRFVAFRSDAMNLVQNDTNDAFDIFVRDRRAGTTQRVSVTDSEKQAKGYSFNPSISAHGRFVAFSSEAPNLVPNDTNGLMDVFVRDRQARTTERVSVDSSGDQAEHSSSTFSRSFSMSADGRFVAFDSGAWNLVANDTNGAYDAFVHDRQTGITERISVDSLGHEANRQSFAPSISAQGRFVAFESDATNLVSNDTNDKPDVFVHDRQTGASWRASVNDLGQQANGGSGGPASISADARSVALASNASNLVPNDTNGAADVFVHELDITAP